VDGSDYNNARFSMGGRVTFLDVGGFRSEWRTDVTVGSIYGLTSEYYHPLSECAKWFIAPRAFVNSHPFDLYKRTTRLAEYRLFQSGVGLDLGYAINRNSEVRLGYEVAYIRARLRIGHPLLFQPAGRTGGTSLQYTYDGLDAPVVPRSRRFFHGDLKIVDTLPGAKQTLPVAEI